MYILLLLGFIWVTGLPFYVCISLASVLYTCDVIHVHVHVIYLVHVHVHVTVDVELYSCFVLQNDMVSGRPTENLLSAILEALAEPTVSYIGLGYDTTVTLSTGGIP